eukprot:3145891-Prymnesium_polylepis.2
MVSSTGESTARGSAGRRAADGPRHPTREGEAHRSHDRTGGQSPSFHSGPPNDRAAALGDVICIAELGPLLTLDALLLCSLWQAMRRIQNSGLSAAWTSWQGLYHENLRQSQARISSTLPTAPHSHAFLTRSQ